MCTENLTSFLLFTTLCYEIYDDDDDDETKARDHNDSVGNGR